MQNPITSLQAQAPLTMRPESQCRGPEPLQLSLRRPSAAPCQSRRRPLAPRLLCARHG